MASERDKRVSRYISSTGYFANPDYVLNPFSFRYRAPHRGAREQTVNFQGIYSVEGFLKSIGIEPTLGGDWDHFAQYNTYLTQQYKTIQRGDDPLVGAYNVAWADLKGRQDAIRKQMQARGRTLQKQAEMRAKLDAAATEDRPHGISVSRTQNTLKGFEENQSTPPVDQQFAPIGLRKPQTPPGGLGV